MTAVSVALGALAAAARGPVDWWLALLTLVGTLCLHAATNLANDYYDYKGGIDTAGSPGVQARRHPLVEGTLAPRHLITGAAAFWIAAAGIGAGLAIARGWQLMALTGIGIAAGFFYSAGPLRLKARALGELTAFLMWGPVMVLGAFFVQRMTFEGTGAAFALSVTQGLWVAQVLLCNNLRDREVDTKLRIHTPATLLGRTAGRMLAVVLCATAYLLTVAEVLTRVLQPWALLTVLSLPLTIKLLLSLYDSRGVPGKAPADAARTAMIFGLLLAASQIPGLPLPG